MTRVWKAEFEKRIAAVEADGELKQKATAVKGAADLLDWHTQNEAKKRDRDAANKSEESAFVEQRDETTPGSEWERVSRLVDLSSKSTRVCTKDTSRLKSLLIQVSLLYFVLA